MKYYFTKETEIGVLTVVEFDGFITGINFGEKPYGKENLTPLISETFNQLEEYFNRKRKEFDLPLKAFGTEFQQKVWIKLREIPYGKTCTYKDLAIAIDNPKACRAVGMANNKNPIPIIIPCHRVIGINGNLTGYAGGLGVKEKLLKIEQL